MGVLNRPGSLKMAIRSKSKENMGITNGKTEHKGKVVSRMGRFSSMTTQLLLAGVETGIPPNFVCVIVAPNESRNLDL